MPLTMFIQPHDLIGETIDELETSSAYSADEVEEQQGPDHAHRPYREQPLQLWLSSSKRCNARVLATFKTRAGDCDPRTATIQGQEQSRAAASQHVCPDVCLYG